MPALSYGTGGCTTCRAGVPVPTPVAQAPQAPQITNLLAQAKGLPWWVWVLGILALASAFRGRRG